MTPSNISSIVSNVFAATTSSTPDTATQPRYAAAFTRREAAIRAVDPTTMPAVNVDVIAAMATVLGVLPKLRELRGDIAKLPEFDLAAVDALEDDTLALGAAHSRWMISASPREALPALGVASVIVRDTLVADATALARRGLLDAQLVASFKSGVGYRAVVRDLMGLTSLLREHWDKVSKVTALDAEELTAASNLADRIVGALGEREQNPAKTVDAALVRQQAYTLWTRAYDEARRAVSYLRWHEGDADKIAPSLFAGRGTRQRTDVAQPAPVTTPATSAGTPTTPTSPTTPHVSAPQAHAAAFTDTVPGLPNADPFITAA